jgi:hypothetical protein
MKIRWNKAVMSALPVFAVLLNITSAWSEGVIPVQILDRVEAFDEKAVLDMKFDELPANRPPDFELLINAPVSNFQACKLTATNGTFCLTDDKVVNWPTGISDYNADTDPDTDDDPNRVDIVSCNDKVFRAKSCTGMTVDLAGNIWLALSNKGKTHNLFKMEASEGVACASGELTEDEKYCATLWAEDKPLLLDLNSVDGDTAAAFEGFDGVEISLIGKSVIGLQERKTAVIFVDDIDHTVIEIASGKREWGLEGNEQLQSIALLQVVNPKTTLVENHVLVTTSKNRIMLAETDGTPDAREVFHISDERDLSSVPCNLDDDQHYGIRTSPKSGLTYVTDRLYCQVLALEPTFDDPDDLDSTKLFGFVNATDSGGDITLSTTGYPVLGPTLAPGASIDLTKCGVGETCTLVSGTESGQAATMSNVTTVPNSETGMTLFLIEGLPDCRLIPAACVALLGLDDASDLLGSVIIDRGTPGGHPAAQLLNVTPLLPLEVTEPFNGVLPAMWISQQYQAQMEPGEKDGFFNAFFGFTDANFSGVFDVVVKVGELTDYKRGCRYGDSDNTPVEELIFKDGPNNEGYDVAVKVSEGFISIDRDYISGTTGNDHEVMLTNTDCGSSRMSGSRWSLWAFDLGFSPDTFDGTDISEDDDAVFAKLLVSLYGDLDRTVNELACEPVDGQITMTSPLDKLACDDFNSSLLNTLDKLDKCLEATVDPKQSSRNQNCQAYVSQFQQLQNTVANFTLTGEDPANRIGEIGVRMLVIDNVYINLFFPSIPDAGFGSL